MHTADIDFHEQKLASVVCSPAHVVEPQTSLRQVIRRMQDTRCGCAVVCDAGGVRGTFTERTVVHRVLSQNVNLDAAVADYMNADVPCLSLEDTIRTAIRLMDEHNVRHLPIWSRERGVIGVVSVRDIIDLVAQYYPTEVLNLPPRLRQKMEKPEGA